MSKVKVILDRDDIVAVADTVRNKAGFTEQMPLSSIINELAPKYKASTTAVAQFENLTYKSTQKALDAATAAGGGTVTLITDAEEDIINVTSGVTLDLNGYTLTANYTVGFDGSHIVDNSTGNTGLLKCSQVKLSKTNSQMPIWNAVDGYVFAVMKHQTKTPTVSADDTWSVTFRPAFGKSFHTLYFGNGAEDNEIEIRCVLEYATSADDDVQSYQFQFSDSEIATAYGSNQAIVFKVTNISSIPTYKARLNVVSKTGVIWVADFN
jgi:hypothetical protein